MACRGVCKQYQWTRKYGERIYLQGAKRCMNDCGEKSGFTMMYDGFWCPCCHHRLRSCPRGSAYKRYYNKVVKRRGL